MGLEGEPAWGNFECVSKKAGASQASTDRSDGWQTTVQGPKYMPRVDFAPESHDQKMQSTRGGDIDWAATQIEMASSGVSTGAPAPRGNYFVNRRHLATRRPFVLA